MKITNGNYEEYVLDYLDGNLPPELTASFEAFLEHHPEIREELAGLTAIVLTPNPKIVYDNKTGLRHSEKNRILLLPPILKWSVAAIFLLLIAFGVQQWWDRGMTPSHPSNSVALSDQSSQEDPNISGQIGEKNAESIKEGERDLSGKKSDQITLDNKSNENIRTTQPQKTGLGFTSVESIVQEDSPFSDLTIQGDSKNPDIINYSDEKNPASKFQTVSFLNRMPIPGPATESRIPESIRMKSTDLLKPEKEDYFLKIHIPEEFLSETWADLGTRRWGRSFLPELLTNH